MECDSEHGLEFEMIPDLRRARFEREISQAIDEAGGEGVRLEDFLDRWRELKGLHAHQLQRLESMRWDYFLATDGASAAEF